MTGPGETPRPPARVRVTADDGLRPAPRDRGAPTRGIALPGAPVRSASDVFAGGLMRSQLRLAIGCLAGLVVVAGAFAAVLLVVPELEHPLLFGVPLSWLLHAYGFYPILLVFAVVYVRGAARNERRYRALLSDPADDA